MKRYIAIARVSSREQEREGFSLDVQVEAFHEFARKHRGVIEQLYRVAETATRRTERTVFREALDYAKKNAAHLDGLLFYKVDRAARNMPDWLELEKLGTDYGLPLLFVTLPTSETPNSKLMVRTLAAVSSYQTEQQSVDVREGIAKRVQEGLFPCQAPYGYRNVRCDDGRSRIEIHPVQAQTISRAFELRAYQHLTVEQIVRTLIDDGMTYCESKPRFPLSKMHRILRDRSYIGEVSFHGTWHPGTHTPIIDSRTWDLVQASFGDRRQKSHTLLFSHGLIRCGHCHRQVTGEKKVKHTKCGPKDYVYYRCCRYNDPLHPRHRIKEKQLETQVERALQSLHFPTPEWEAWATSVAAAYLEATLGKTSLQLTELRRQESLTRESIGELLNLRLAGRINDGQFDQKNLELQQRVASLGERIQFVERASLQVEQKARSATVVFETIRQRWRAWDIDTKHQLLRTLFETFELRNEQLVEVGRTPIELFRRTDS